MKLYRALDYKDLSRKAANLIAAQVMMKPDCVLGLATGSTPIGTYEQLVEKYQNGDLDFKEVKSANLLLFYESPSVQACKYPSGKHEYPQRYGARF